MYRRFDLYDCGALEENGREEKRFRQSGKQHRSGCKTRRNCVEFRNQIDTEANDEQTIRGTVAWSRRETAIAHGGDDPAYECVRECETREAPTR